MKLRSLGLALLGALSMMSAHAEEPSPDGLLTQELMTFVATLQSAVKSDSPEQVAPLIQFPLRVNMAQGRAIQLTARRFSAEYGKIFSTVKAAVLQQAQDDIFRNSNGAMLGNGEVWIVALPRSELSGGAAKGDNHKHRWEITGQRTPFCFIRR